MSWPFTNLEWVGTATSSCEAKVKAADARALRRHQIY